MLLAFLTAGQWRLVAIVAAALAVVFLGAVFAGPEGSIGERRLRSRLGGYAPPPEGSRFLGRIRWLRGAVRRAEDTALRAGLRTSLDRTLEQANLPLGAGEAVLVAAALAVVAGAVAGLATGSLAIALLAGVFTVLAAAAAAQAMARLQLERFESQLPDTLGLLATSLRAGYSLLQAIEAVASQVSDPTAREFTRALSDIRLGRDVTESLRGVAERMGSLDFGWAVMAVEIQREVGGNLAEVLTTAASTLVARSRLRRDVKALTAEGRLTAVVLTLVPFGLFAFVWTVNRDYLEPLLDETLGRVALAVAGALIVVGIYWLRRIMDVEL